MQVIPDDDLDLVETTLPDTRLVSVNSGSGTPFTMKLRPRSVADVCTNNKVMYYMSNLH